MMASQRNRSSVSRRTLRRCGRWTWSAVSSSMGHFRTRYGVLQCFHPTHRQPWRNARELGLAPGGAPRHIWAMPAAAAEPAIAVDRLVKRYKTVSAVDGISFAIDTGSCTALLGGNGAG